MVKLNSDILRNVQKPARYVGGEYNQVIKNKDDVKVRFAFAFPDTYEIGMANIGIRILYNVLNKRKDTWCERAYAPWPDMEEKMRENNIPLYGHESKDPLDMFDMIGFTLQYEMSFTNILNMLDLAGIPVESKDRENDFPFIIAGGPCSCNPYPIARFIDIFLVGEGEEVLNELMDKYVEWKESNLPKRAYLESIKDIQGLYIPAVHTKEDKIVKRIIKDLDSVTFPTKFVVPSTEIVQDRISIEVFRGCKNGCRFCQAGYIYRPVREKSVDTLTEQAKLSLQNTGIDDISLCSLSTSDYPAFLALAQNLFDISKEKKVSISLPSLRIDTMSVDILKKVNEVRKSGLTFAPEAGTQRLRNVINKNITKENILKSAKLAFENGWNTLKFYFMIGLPTETYEDLDGIVDIAKEVLDLYYSLPKEKRHGRCNITVSTSTFVPKPHTPFQWFGQETMENVVRKQNYLKAKLRMPGVKYSWHESKVSMMEATLARGGEEMADIVKAAWQNGARFDGWDEMYNEKAWLDAFEKYNIDPQEYASREFTLDDEFPWDNIFAGVNKEFLKKEYRLAMEAITTPKCSEKCAGCGVNTKFKCKYLNAQLYKESLK